jgi:AraC-like DNA-binding protein
MSVQINRFGIMTLIGMVREFAGPRWQPTEIGVMVNHPTSRFIREQLGGMPIRLAQPYSYIALENTLLSLPPLGHQTAESGYPNLHCKELSGDLVGSLKQLLHSYLLEKDLTIGLASGLCDMSKRSLQRKLLAQGTTYSRVLDETRFEVAKRMLQDPEKSVTEISLLLGYSNASHFSRAFRRIAGVNPRIYRQQYRHSAADQSLGRRSEYTPQTRPAKPWLHRYALYVLFSIAHECDAILGALVALRF